ncbi:hypothetical protein CSA57_14090 [candidate division KSB3 bacterium]|nr:MAG: hypothetical protein CSA57_14090 [candidate division KSB3 bacterium]
MIRHSVSRMNVKILHITKMKGISGSENHLFTLLSGLHKQHFTVELCILVEQVHVELLQEIKQTLALQGVTVSMLIIPKYGSIQLILKLRNYIIQERFDIVHTHLIHADI